MTQVLRPTMPRRRMATGNGHMTGPCRELADVVEHLVDPLYAVRNGWSLLQAPFKGNDPLDGQLGQPGLWRAVGSGKAVRRVFELPPLPACDDDGEPLADGVGAECRAWALATAAGNLPDGWQPPARDEAESWIAPGCLTVRVGAHARQAALVHEAGRLALTCPILTNIPAHLSPARRGWLHAVVRDGQDRWRLVRIGLTETAALAEVDLSGVPPAIVESVFRTSLDALRWVVSWLVESAAFLADPSVTCQALEVCPSAGSTRGKE